MSIYSNRRHPIKRQNDKWLYQLQQYAYSTKYQPRHRTLTATDLGTDDNNKKPGLTPATTTPAIDLLKATLAIIPTEIQSLGTWIRRTRWNWSQTRNVYYVATKDTTTRIAGDDRPNDSWLLHLKPCQSQENQGQKYLIRITSRNDTISKQLSRNLPSSARY